MRHVAGERCGEFIRRLADQVGLADAREEFSQALDAAGLRFAAGDPKNVGKTGERLGRRIGIGGLGIVDEENGPAAADFLHPMGEAREGSQPRLNRRRLQAERQRCGRGAGGILRVVQSAQRADAAKLGDREIPLPYPPPQAGEGREGARA